MISKYLVLTLIGGFQGAVAITHRLNFTYIDGQDFVLTADHGNLSVTPVAKLCNSGFWTIYEEPNFGVGGTVEILPGIHGQCTIPVTPTIRSARMVGSQLNNSLTSVSFFSRNDFGGEILVIIDGVPDLPFPIMSFVAMNTKSLEFFKDVNYQGESFCLDYWAGATFWLWRWEGFNTPWEGSLARSARIGCDWKSSTVVRTEASSGNVSRKL